MPRFDDSDDDFYGEDDDIYADLKDDEDFADEEPTIECSNCGCEMLEIAQVLERPLLRPRRGDGCAVVGHVHLRSRVRATSGSSGDCNALAFTQSGTCHLRGSGACPTGSGSYHACGHRARRQE